MKSVIIKQVVYKGVPLAITAYVGGISAIPVAAAFYYLLPVLKTGYRIYRAIF